MDWYRPPKDWLAEAAALLASLEASVATLRLKGDASDLVAALQETVDEIRAKLFRDGGGR